MTSRLSTIAALLMVGAMLAANPVLAASDRIDPDPGSADSTATREGPIELPKFTPRPMPLVAPETNRGLPGDLDDELQLASLGTVTWHPGGSVEVSAPSAALTAVFEAQTKTHS